MTAEPHDSHAPNERFPAHHPLVAAALVILLVGWTLMMRRFGVGNVYAEMGMFSAGCIVVVLALRHRTSLSALRPNVKAIATGVGVGIISAILTYPAFELASALLPTLAVEVERLYATANQAPLAQELAWALLIIVAEELLFRVFLIETLERRFRLSAVQVGSIAVVAYTIGQLGSGSLVVAAMAGVMGTLWTVQRMWTGSALSPLIAHLIWTPTVIILVPVVHL